MSSSRDGIAAQSAHFASTRLATRSYDAPGEQDITADVNFTALAAAAREYGVEPLALVTQSQFLVGIGEDTQFADAFSECKLPQEHTKRALQLKHLDHAGRHGRSVSRAGDEFAGRKGKGRPLSGLKFVRKSDRI